jgi:hypothetical protein
LVRSRVIRAEKEHPPRLVLFERPVAAFDPVALELLAQVVGEILDLLGVACLLRVVLVHGPGNRTGGVVGHGPVEGVAQGRTDVGGLPTQRPRQPVGLGQIPGDLKAHPPVGVGNVVEVRLVRLLGDLRPLQHLAPFGFLRFLVARWVLRLGGSL